MKANRATRPLGVLLLVGSVAAAFAPAAALAQQKAEGGWYTGLSFGATQIGLTDNTLPIAGATATTFSKDESSTGFKIFGGYRFNKNFALEGGYTDLGKFNASREAIAPFSGSLSRSTKASGFDLSAVGIIPMQNGFSLFGKVGAMYTMSEGSVSTSGALLLAPDVSTNPKRSEWNPKVGIGADYAFSNGLGLRLEYERINNVGDSRTGEGNVGIWSLGLSKRY